MIDYIKKHWRGELSLPVSYWLNSFLANIIAYSIILIISTSIERSLTPLLILLALVSIYSLILAVVVWQITGTWRSAENHKVRTGRKGWAIAAQVTIVLGVIQSVKVFTDGSKQIIEAVKIITGTDEYAKFSVKLRNGTDLHISGYIAFKLVDELDKYFNESRDIRSIHLNSAGGRIAPARHIAALILSKKLNTYSDVGCLSACTIVFIAGKARVVSVGTKLGFHRGAMPGVSDAEMKSVAQDEIKFYLSRGIPYSFAQKAFGTPNSEIWYPTYRELMDANVVTHVTVGKKFIPIRQYCRKANCDKISTAPQWLQKTAAILNLTVPKKIDAVTILDRAMSGPKKNFTYLYTLHSKQDTDFDELSRNVINLACTNPKLALFFKNGITMHWKYRDQKGKALHEVILSPADCKKYRKTSR